MPGDRLNAASRSLRPARLLAIVIVAFFAAMPFLPMSATGNPSLFGIVYWLLVMLAMWLGLLWGERSPAKVRTTPVKYADAARYTVVLGLAGVALLAFDRFVLRSAPLDWNVLAFREAVEGTSTGVVGMLAAFVGSFAPFAFVMCAVARARGETVSPSWRLGAAVAVLLYVAMSVMQGSRSVLLVVVIIHVATWVYLSRFGGRRVPARSLWLGAALLLSTVLGSAAIMLDRFEKMGLDPVLSLQVSGYAESLQPSNAALNWIESHPESSGMFAALFSLCLYLYHGFFEFSHLYEQFAADHTKGAWIFWLPLKLISVVSGESLGVEASQLAGVREGIFSTFVGPVYIDFGWFGPVFALLLGRVLAVPVARLAAGRHMWLPASSMVCATILMSPMLNLLDSAAGAYLLVSAVVVTQFGRVRQRRPSPQEESSQRPVEAA